MRYVLNGPLKEFRNKRRTDKTRTKFTETTLVTPTSIHTNTPPRNSTFNDQAAQFLIKGQKKIKQRVQFL